MRFMWLWLLLYGLVVGAALFFLGLALALGFAFTYPAGLSGDIGEVGSGMAVYISMGGFLALITGMILFLVRAKSAVARALSLVGMGLYHIAALGVITATSVVWLLRGFGPEIVYVFALVAVLVVLPAVFIFRKLRRAQ